MGASGSSRTLSGAIEKLLVLDLAFVEAANAIWKQQRRA